MAVPVANVATPPGGEAKPIDRWVARLSAATLPVLGRTLADLSELRRDEDNVRPRDISQLVLHDPFMALRVLRFLKDHRSSRALADITTVEHALMMLGISPFFRNFTGLRSVEHQLQGDRVAMAGLMIVVARSRHAALHAHEWAQLRHDIESDEVVIAALLHDMAEMLLWCFAPAEAGEIATILARDQAQRSAEVQREVLGCGLNELQLALAIAWGLPPVMTSLMDDFRADRPRARNVMLAVNLARHASHGWEDAALPDDIDGVSRLLGRPQMEVRQRIFQTALETVRDHGWYGDAAPPVWLPPFPMQVGHVEGGAGPRNSDVMLVRIKRLLGATEGEDLLNWGSGAGSPKADGPAETATAAIALAMFGLYKGVGLARQVYCSIDESGLRAQARYINGIRESERIARVILPLGRANAFTTRLADEGVIWWRPVDDPVALPELPREWRVAAGADGLFAGLIRTADGRGALLYADGGGAPNALNEDKFTHFREICDLLSLHLAGPVGEPEDLNPPP